MNAPEYDVEEFHRKFNIQYDGPPRILPPDLAAFRNKRAFDEVQEIVDAMAGGDIEMVLDGILDTIYILLGTAHLCGFKQQVIALAWQRIHAANMAKQLATTETGSPHGDLGVRNGDIIKPPGWTHPTFKDLLCQDS